MFITGTDTGIGKTWAALALMQALQTQGLKVIGMKPVASGAHLTPQGLRNEDAEALQHQALPQVVPYALINPYLFEPPIAPHVAAAQAGVVIELEKIVQTYHLLRQQADRVIVEGAGGWRVPLGPTLGWADVVRALELEVVLVVGLRLGCINHALLSAEAIIGDGLVLRGWVANQLDSTYLPMPTLETLEQRINAPFMGVIPHARHPDGSALRLK